MATPRRRAFAFAPYVFLLPAGVFFVLFLLWPMVEAFILSLEHVESLQQSAFVGLGNYATLIADPSFRLALWNTTEFMLGSVFVLSPFALLLAIAIHSQHVRWKMFYRLALFFPITTSQVVVGIIFVQLLSTRFGWINAALHHVFGFPAVPWLTSPSVVMLSLILVAIWGFTGLNVLYFLAGLEGLPEELFEAARLDGASRFQTLTRITLPLLKPVILFVIIQAIVGSYQLFARPFILTGGGPENHSLTIVLYLYLQAFEKLQWGLGAAAGFVLTVVILGLSLLMLVLFGEIRVPRRNQTHRVRAAGRRNGSVIETASVSVMTRETDRDT